ncbi:MAG: hypothetical protein MK538_14860 [Planctomycetes bacterium]|nr:hypothetical protein [Planctomycetota bacterium]
MSNAMLAGNSAPTRFLCVVSTLLTMTSGCVSEQVDIQQFPGVTSLFRFRVTYPTRVLDAGSYHGTNLFFEMDVEKDLRLYEPADTPLQLPPITPRISTAREVYDVGSLHRVELAFGRWHVGAHRYTARNRSRLYIFKHQRGDFTFSFRGQEIVVRDDYGWTPSIYYYLEEKELDIRSPVSRNAPERTSDRPTRHHQIVREVLQVGMTTIEVQTDNGTWHVNGRPYEPDLDRSLLLTDAVNHSRGR